MADLATFKADKRALRTTSVEVKENFSISDQAYDEATSKITALIEECKALIARNPLYNQATKENRKWAGAKAMYGNTVHKAIHELFTGIQRATAEHRMMMIAKVGLSENLINRVVTAFGRPASFYQEVYQDELDYDLTTLNVALDMIEDSFDIYIDRSEISPKLVRATFENQRNRALSAQCDHERTVLERTQNKLINAQTVAELAI